VQNVSAGKTPVSGLLKREGNVYVQIVKNCSKAELMPIIEGKILEKVALFILMVFKIKDDNGFYKNRALPLCRRNYA
jgi:transposase-like protein